MFEFIAVVVLANLILLAVLYVLRHVIAIRAPVLLIAVGISILYCILYPFLMALVSYPQVLYLYVFLVVAGAGSLYVIESRLFAVGELKDAERPVEAGVIAYIPEAGLPIDMEEAADMAASTESADVPVEDKPAMADKITEVYITEDEVAALLKAADNGRLEGAEEDISFYTEDEIAAVEEGPGPADIQAEGVPGRDNSAAGEITATLEEPAVADPVDTVEEAGFSGADGKDSDINIEEFLPVEEESVLAYEEEAAVPDGEWPVPETWLPEGLPETAHVAAEVLVDEAGFSGADGKDSDINIEEFLPVEEESVLAYEEEAAVPDGEWPVPETWLPEGLPETAHVAAEVVEDVPGLADKTIAGHITADEVAAILEVAGAGEQERAGEDISFYGPDDIAAFEEGPEPAEVVVDITGWDDAVADETTATLEGPDTEGPVEHESTEETAAVAGEEYGDIAAEEQTLPGDDLSSLVAMAFDKLASGDSAGAVDSFFRALKLGPPPKLAVMLCTRISSIYSSQGLHRQALAVMEMLEVVWGPMLDDSDREGITTIIIQLRGEV